jgi:dTDP-4-dehydrorhamnose reductase
MRLIVLGAAGMLGHKLLQRLRTDFEIAGTIRDREPGPELQQAISGVKLYPEVAANNLPSLARVVEEWRPQIVLNCIGIVKQRCAASDPILSIAINSLFPHQVAQLAAAHGAKMIHFSTDCVFSGRHGNYVEDDVPDPVDLYGRSKLLGEVATPGALTLRMSVIGRELRRHIGLIDWFLSQRGRRVNGYARALYTGLTTIVAADLIAWLIRAHPGLEGLWHVSADPISKFDLLQMVNRVYRLGVEITRDETFVCDRRLDSSRFRRCTGWQPPGWEQMVDAMHSDEQHYGGA